MLSVITLHQVEKLLKDPPTEYMPRFHKAHIEIEHKILPAKNNEISLQTSFLIPFFWVSYDRNVLDYVCDKLMRLEQFKNTHEFFA